MNYQILHLKNRKLRTNLIMDITQKNNPKKDKLEVDQYVSYICPDNEKAELQSRLEKDPGFLHKLAERGKLGGLPKSWLTEANMCLQNSKGETPAFLAANSKVWGEFPKELITTKVLSQFTHYNLSVFQKLCTEEQLHTLDPKLITLEILTDRGDTPGAEDALFILASDPHYDFIDKLPKEIFTIKALLEINDEYNQNVLQALHNTDSLHLIDPKLLDRGYLVVTEPIHLYYDIDIQKNVRIHPSAQLTGCLIIESGVILQEGCKIFEDCSVIPKDTTIKKDQTFTQKDSYKRIILNDKIKKAKEKLNKKLEDIPSI
jgi:hypothetical protein